MLECQTLKSKSPKPKSPSRIALEKVLETLPLGAARLFRHRRKIYGFGDFEHIDREDMMTILTRLADLLLDEDAQSVRKKTPAIVKSYWLDAVLSEAKPSLKAAEREGKIMYQFDASGTVCTHIVTGGQIYAMVKEGEKVK